MLDDLRNKHAVMPMKRPACRFAAVASQQSIRSNTGIVDTRERETKMHEAKGDWSGTHSSRTRCTVGRSGDLSSAEPSALVTRNSQLCRPVTLPRPMDFEWRYPRRSHPNGSQCRDQSSASWSVACPRHREDAELLFDPRRRSYSTGLHQADPWSWGLGL